MTTAGRYVRCLTTGRPAAAVPTLDSPLAPRYLYRAAELAEDKVKDEELARSVYRQLAENYPQTEFGKKASKKIR